MNNELKSKLYDCILKQFPDPGLYKVSRVIEWLCTNGYTLVSLGYDSFRECEKDFN